MSVRSGQSITVLATTRVFSTGAASNADSLPTGTLYLNGVSNAASVTVTNLTTGVYSVAVTLPTLAVGDVVDLRLAATVSSVSDNAVIWRDSKDVLLDSSGKTTDATQTGDSYAIVNSGTFGNSAIKGYVDDIGVAGAGLTALGDARLANLDAAVSSRSTYVGGDTSGTTTLLSRVSAAVALAGSAPSWYSAPVDVSANVSAIKAKTDNLPADPAGLAGLASAHGAGSWATATGFSTLDAAGVRSAVGLATPSLDAQLSLIDADVLSRSTYAGADTAGTTTMLSRVTGAVPLAADYTQARAAKLDDLDAAVSTRLPTTSYVAQTGDAYAEAVSIYNLLSAAGLTISVSSPVPSAGGVVTLIRGDDYRDRDGRPLLWNVTTTLDLLAVSTAITLSIYDTEGVLATTATCTATAITGGFRLKADLTAAQTAAILHNQYVYALRATLANGDVLTLAGDDVVVRSH